MDGFIQHFNDFLAKPSSVYNEESRKTSHSVLLFILGLVSITMSFFITLYSYKSAAWAALLASLAFAAFLFLAALKSTALYNMACIFGVKYREGQTASSLFLSILELHGIFIYTLPAAFIIQFISKIAGEPSLTGLIFIVYAALFIIYFIFLILTLNKHFSLSAAPEAVVIMLAPGFVDSLSSVAFMVFAALFIVSFFAV